MVKFSRSARLEVTACLAVKIRGETNVQIQFYLKTEIKLEAQ